MTHDDGGGGIVVVSQVWLSPGEGPRAGRLMYSICVTLSRPDLCAVHPKQPAFLLLSSEHPSSDSLRHLGPSHVESLFPPKDLILILRSDSHSDPESVSSLEPT